MADGKEGQGEGQPKGNGQGESQPLFEFEYVVNGEKRSAKPSRQEVINRWQMAEDYTHKTQKLSEKEKQIDALVQQKAQEEALKLLEELQKGEGSEEVDGKEGDPKNLSAEAKRLKAMEAELADLKKFREEHSNRVSQAEQDKFLDEQEAVLVKKYPGMDWEKVMVRFAKQAKETDDPKELFESLAKQSHEESEKRRQTIIDEYVKAKSGRSPSEAGSRGTPSGEQKPEPPKTFAEARARAEKRIEAMNA